MMEIVSTLLLYKQYFVIIILLFGAIYYLICKYSLATKGDIKKIVDEMNTSKTENEKEIESLKTENEKEVLKNKLLLKDCVTYKDQEKMYDKFSNLVEKHIDSLKELLRESGALK